MRTSLGAGAELDNDSSLTGTFQVSLTRAVLPYRDQSERDLPGGTIGDIGLGVVVEGDDPARADVLDLGSARTRLVDLTGPLVVLGWLYPSGLRSLRRAVDGASREEVERARAFTFSVALRSLNAAGFGPLTRPTVLRIGFRDLCQDLDLHEGTAVRLLLPSGGVSRIHLDYETVTLLVRTGRSAPERDFETALVEAFGPRELLRGGPADSTAGQAYHLPLPVPRSLADTRRLLDRIRRGLGHLLARFEPDRFQSLTELSKALGERDSLRALRDRAEEQPMEAVVPPVRSSAGVTGIH